MYTRGAEGTPSLHRTPAQYNSPHPQAGSKLCSLPGLTPQKTLVSAAQPQDDSRLMPPIGATATKMSPCTVYPALRNTQGTAYMDSPQHWSTAESHCSHSELSPVLCFHGIKQHNLPAPLDHSCWDVWASLTPMGTHLHIPATGPSN